MKKLKFGTPQTPIATTLFIHIDFQLSELMKSAQIPE